MEERQVTVEGKTFPLSADFFVVATQNPEDYEGTFALPEVQLDRFLFKITSRHADIAAEIEVLRKVMAGQLPPPFDKLGSFQIERARIDAEIGAVKVDDSILGYVAKLLDATRRHALLSTGSSVRGGIALTRCARILALAQGRDFVTPDDIKYLAPFGLAHRTRLNPEAQVARMSADGVIGEILAKTEFPA
jgi:MoxR-like ATPase